VNRTRLESPADHLLVAVGDLIEDVRVRPVGPIRVATDTPSHIERRLGGSAAQVALAAAHDGTPSAFIGNVGADAAGDRLLADLVEAGVTTHVTRSGRTGTVVALLAADGERTMLTDRGSAGALGGIEAAWLRGASVLHVPAYSLLDEPLAGATQEAVRAVRDHDALISVDASSVGAINDYGPARFVKLIGALAPDVVFANFAEAGVLAAHTAIGDLGTIVVVKQGPDPAMVHHAAGPTEVPVPESLTLADSTGAGDAFAAGFLGGLLRDLGPAEAARRGHEVAARTLRQP
jgi:sugar/nucleoside kinase (ribokinase family)